MNPTRIEVPLTLPTPHFDDERTIATARQVTPIGHTKVTESWRRLRMLLPLILLATFCGALGAAGVNYYEARRSGETVTHPVIQNLTPAANTEPSPVAVAATADTNSKVDNNKEAVSVEPKPEATPAPEAPPAANSSSDRDVSPDKPAMKPEKKNTDPDATKLTRKRRVNSPDEEGPTSKKGAGRITDIFGGPNP